MHPLLLLALAAAGTGSGSDWRVYHGDAAGLHYSTLDQIRRDNVARLKVAWTYDTGDAFEGSEMECNPLAVDGVLYATTPRLRVIALDGATGKLRWAFDPNPPGTRPRKTRSRGLSYWESGGDRRIFVAAGAHLYALDARTGKPVDGFGAAGRIDLREGLGRPPATLSVSSTSPGVIYRDLIIMGSIVSEDLPSAPGDIRAYDVRTGKLRWSFHTIPHPGEPGYETWPKDGWKHSGGANNWAGMSLDEKRGLLFVPTGSAAFDFYGADRAGDNLYANCLLALKADTGERVWHFQGVHHDVWDRDFPAPPVLVTVERGGRPVDAVAQTTKSGYVYLFERETGKPLFPVAERAVPASDVDGEALAKMQPFPLRPAPFARQELTPELVTDRTPAAREAVLARLKTLRSGGQFTPPSRQGTVIFPGFDGGAEWGGPAWDPQAHLLYVNANEMAWVLRLVPRPRTAANARELYLRDCAGCHRQDLRGTPPEFPNLLESRRKLTAAQIAAIIRRGRGRMPAFGSLGSAAGVLARYVATGRNAPVSAGAEQVTLKYSCDGYNKFLDPEGYPAVKPPWGTLTAINLDSGDFAWRVPLGEYPELAARGMTNTGSENYGGPLVTAGGLLFIAATVRDRKIRAFDKTSGELLWQASLPASGNATPATYEAGGRQYVVVAAGGGKWGAAPGGSYVAFALDGAAAALRPRPSPGSPGTLP